MKVSKYTNFEMLEKILNLVSKIFGVTPDLILSESRKDDICIARNTLSLIAYEAGYTCKKIGDFIHRHYSVVLYEKGEAYNECDINFEYKRKVNHIREILNDTNCK
jgi:chromosomal replication initiation ATPase DnaA